MSNWRNDGLVHAIQLVADDVERMASRPAAEQAGACSAGLSTSAATESTTRRGR